MYHPHPVCPSDHMSESKFVATEETATLDRTSDIEYSSFDQHSMESASGENTSSADSSDSTVKQFTTTKPTTATIAKVVQISNKLKKAPGAPKRFKSAFIFFSAEKHKQIRAQMSNGSQNERARTGNLSKIVSEAWKLLLPEEKAAWETLARNDRSRYEVEKSLYKGPWQVLKTRKQKDTNAPKRPMSAFLAFANSRRAEVKRQTPEMSNGDVSRTLSAMWKEAPEEVRKRYIDEELEKRQEYLAAIADWRNARREEERAERQKREQLAVRVAKAMEADIRNSNLFYDALDKAVSHGCEASGATECMRPAHGLSFTSTRALGQSAPMLNLDMEEQSLAGLGAMSSCGVQPFLAQNGWSPTFPTFSYGDLNQLSCNNRFSSQFSSGAISQATLNCPPCHVGIEPSEFQQPSGTWARESVPFNAFATMGHVANTNPPSDIFPMGQHDIKAPMDGLPNSQWRNDTLNLNATELNMGQWQHEISRNDDIQQVDLNFHLMNGTKQPMFEFMPSQ